MQWLFFRIQCLVFLLLMVGSVGMGYAQPNQSDYERAVSFIFSRNLEHDEAQNLDFDWDWTEDGAGVWYAQRTKHTREFHLLTLDGRDKVLFDHQKLFTALQSLTEDKLDAHLLPFSRLISVNGDNIRFRFKGKRYLWVNSNAKLTEDEEPQGAPAGVVTSPDGKWVAFVKNYNVWLRNTEDSTTQILSTTGSKHYTYGSYYGWFDKMDGENRKRPKRVNLQWSPDSKWLYAPICDVRYAKKMYLLNHSVDSLFRPSLHGYYRGSPGDTTMVRILPAFFELSSGEEYRPHYGRPTHINPVSVKWGKKSGQVITEYTERGYQTVHIHELNLKKQSMKELYTETSKTNLDGFTHHYLEELDRHFILSEQSGWRHLHELDLKTGKATPLTEGEYYVHRVEHADGDKQRLYLSIAGKENDATPYQERFYVYDLKENELKLLTPEKAHHIIEVHPEGKFFYDTYSTPSDPGETVLRSLDDGRIVAHFPKPDIAGLKALNWKFPALFTVKSTNGKYDLHGAMWLPTGFELDENKPLPIIDATYTGPHTQRTPRSFLNGIERNYQALAELGFIVVAIDGVGSSGRSKAFHDYSYRKLGNNLEDHVTAIRELGTRHAWIDTTRVGIFGHSAGGYDAGHALLAFPDFYDVGVASSADHDHRMEKAWWPEMYMGWPVDSHYHHQSNITMAGNLKGKLLIAHGGMDDNVNPSASFKLAEALIKADKNFDLLILPSQRHGYVDEYYWYFKKRRWNYFVEHLHGVKPVWDFSWDTE